MTVIYRGGDLSESEAELDGPHNEVVVPQERTGRGNIKGSKSAIRYVLIDFQVFPSCIMLIVPIISPRLSEIGPRMRLQLIKIEEGTNSGEVLYHRFVEKTSEEIHTQKKDFLAKKLVFLSFSLPTIGVILLINHAVSPQQEDEREEEAGTGKEHPEETEREGGAQEAQFGGDGKERSA